MSIFIFILFLFSILIAQNQAEKEIDVSDTIFREDIDILKADIVRKDEQMKELEMEMQNMREELSQLSESFKLGLGEYHEDKTVETSQSRNREVKTYPYGVWCAFRDGAAGPGSDVSYDRLFTADTNLEMIGLDPFTGESWLYILPSTAWCLVPGL